jgi:hypothetical protein
MTEINKEDSMFFIDIKKFGLAWALTFSLLYIGCIYTMAILGKDGSILFFNSLLHGIDVSAILKMDMPLWEIGMGLSGVFIMGWLVGGAIAGIYNLSMLKGSK